MSEITAYFMVEEMIPMTLIGTEFVHDDDYFLVAEILKDKLTKMIQENDLRGLKEFFLVELE